MPASRNTLVVLVYVAMLLFSSIGAADEGLDNPLAEPKALAHEACTGATLETLTVDSGHPWVPPFGNDRVGALPVVHVQLKEAPAPTRSYSLAAYRNGREIERHALTFTGNGPYQFGPSVSIPSVFANVRLSAIPQEIALFIRCRSNQPLTELARQAVAWPDLEADAQARPDFRLNPIDLGAVLVPHDWLLLTKGQSALVNVAALVHDRDIPRAYLRVAFEGSVPVESNIRLIRGKKRNRALKVPLTATGDRSVLQLSLWDGDQVLWRKSIRTMIVEKAPTWPTFGAMETKLRYDAPVLRHDPKTGQKLPPLDYESAWDPKLNDVVVFLPNGSRFVFWRGSSYAPFWAGRENTGVNYQWAEDLSHPTTHPAHPNAITDFPEVMFDSALRYSEVRIIASTSSRIHIRWTHQPTTIYDDVRGEQVTEDFFFYPDSFGTRVVTLNSPREERAKFQVSEFLILAPQAAFPLDILPKRMIEVLGLDGRSTSVFFPVRSELASPAALSDAGFKPAVYRIFAHKDDPAAAIYFSPRQAGTPFGFLPIKDQGEIVTPAYWGGYWPLARGEPTSWGINDRIFSSPSFSSLAAFRPLIDSTPFEVRESTMIDALGRSREMVTQIWFWLIAQTNAPDDLLRSWAKSFSSPPSLEGLKGARLDFPSYSPERRAMRLIVEQASIQARLTPQVVTVNPVFELTPAPGVRLGRTLRVLVDEKSLPPNAYAWDGQTLWMRVAVAAAGAEIGIEFQ